MKIKAKDVQAGDVMGFPIGAGVYAFARVLFRVEGMCCLVEIFDYQGLSLDFNDRILESKRLVQIQNVSAVSILSREWGGVVVHRDPGFKPDLEELKSYEILNGNQVMKYDIEWTPDCGRMRYIVVFEMRKDNISEAGIRELKDRLPCGNVILNNYMVIVMIREAWKLEPYKWESGAKMYVWFEENGVYHTRPPRVRVAKGE